MTVYLSIIVFVWVVTWIVNKKRDDDPIQDFLRIVGSTFLTVAVLFFWHWI